MLLFHQLQIHSLIEHHPPDDDKNQGGGSGMLQPVLNVLKAFR